MGNRIGAIILSVIAIICFIVSFFQLNEKGFLFNNGYIYASKQERERMDKKAYYKQSGVVFLLLGIIFLMNAVNLIVQTGWLFYFIIGIAMATLVYSIVSSVFIEKSKNVEE